MEENLLIKMIIVFFGEYYLLNKSGMLEFRDNNGLIDTGQK